MIIEETENGDLDFNSENYDTLKRGVVVFPETLSEAERLNTLKDYIQRNWTKIIYGY